MIDTDPKNDAEQQTDLELQAAVIEELAWTPSVDNTHIGVSANRGAVTLSGKVDTYPERWLAEKAALRVHGVRAVAEDIVVRHSWAARDDADIALEATEALDRAIDVPRGAVQAVVSGRHITLSGNVPWNFQRQAADRAVRYVRGVFGVSSAVTITPSVPATSIESAVTEALGRNAALEGTDVSVTSDEGAITLDGTVRSWQECREAENTCWSAPGVSRVANRLHIAS